MTVTLEKLLDCIKTLEVEKDKELISRIRLSEADWNRLGCPETVTAEDEDGDGVFAVFVDPSLKPGKAVFDSGPSN